MDETVKDSPRPPSSPLRAAGLISVLIMVSRVLGLVREQVFAALLGAGFHADAFQVAFRIPNLLRDLFAEGALTAAFLPTYARTLASGGAQEAYRLASRLLSLLAVVLGGLVVVGIVFAEPLVRLLAPGFADHPGKTELTVVLTRVMLPFLPLVSFAAVTMGMLNARERYGTPALAPAMFNLVAIASGALLWALGLGPAQVALGWAAGTLLGGLAQLLIQVPPLWSAGWRFRPDWAPRDPGLRAIGSLMAPAIVGLAAVQVNIFVSTFFASHEQGAVSWLQYAFRILYLPIGIFGVALGTVATTGLANRAAAGDVEGVRRTLGQSLRMLGFLTLPATAGLMVLAVPIVRLLFERGLFGPDSTRATAAALALYSIGLVSYTGVKVLAPAFYALGHARIALWASGAAVVTNLVVIGALHERFGFGAIALGTALGSLANVIVLGIVFERKIGGLAAQLFTGSMAKMGLASAVMAAVCWVAWQALEMRFAGRSLPSQLITGLGPVLLGVAVFLALARALAIPEARAAFAALRRPR